MSRRTVAAVIIVLAAVALAILAWPQLFGLARAPVAAQVVSLRGLALVAGLVGALLLTVIALLSAIARRLAASLAIVLLAFCAVNGAVLATRGLGNPAFESPTESSLTVLSWNTLGDAPGAAVIAGLAIEESAGVVALPETTNATGVEVAAIMESAGLPMQVFTLAYDESPTRSTTLLISADLGEYEMDESLVTTVMPTVVATPLSGSGPVLMAVHTGAPIPPMTLVWGADLKRMAVACSGDNVIMAGDFNATVDHLDGLGAGAASLGSCRDAAFASGNAAVGTWPTFLPPLLGAPIDHVMATGDWRVNGMRVIESHDGYGSDHRPILVQLSPDAD